MVKINLESSPSFGLAGVKPILLKATVAIGNAFGALDGFLVFDIFEDWISLHKICGVLFNILSVLAAIYAIVCHLTIGKFHHDKGDSSGTSDIAKMLLQCKSLDSNVLVFVFIVAYKVFVSEKAPSNTWLTLSIASGILTAVSSCYIQYMSSTLSSFPPSTDKETLKFAETYPTYYQLVTTRIRVSQCQGEVGKLQRMLCLTQLESLQMKGEMGSDAARERVDTAKKSLAELEILLAEVKDMVEEYETLEQERERFNIRLSDKEEKDREAMREIIKKMI